MVFTQDIRSAVQDRSVCRYHLTSAKCSYPQVQVGDVDGVGQHDADGQQPAAEGEHEGRHPRLHRVQHEAVAVDSNEQEAERRDVHRDVLQHRTGQLQCSVSSYRAVNAKCFVFRVGSGVAF